MADLPEQIPEFGGRESPAECRDLGHGHRVEQGCQVGGEQGLAGGSGLVQGRAQERAAGRVVEPFGDGGCQGEGTVRLVAVYFYAGLQPQVTGGGSDGDEVAAALEYPAVIAGGPERHGLGVDRDADLPGLAGVQVHLGEPRELAFGAGDAGGDVAGIDLDYLLAGQRTGIGP